MGGVVVGDGVGGGGVGCQIRDISHIKNLWSDVGLQLLTGRRAYY